MLTSSEVLREAEVDHDYYYKTAFSDNNDEVVFDRNAVVSVQPFSGNETRKPLPIPTISGSSLNYSSTLPITGLALLHDIQEITVEQTIEIYDLVAAVDSENRYLIKTDGQTIYGGHETSSGVQRLLCGMGRAFLMRLFDRSQQEALYMTRRMACSIPLLGCYLQRMDVFEPPCKFLGCIQQQYTVGGSLFSIQDQDHNEVYTINGPSSAPCCGSYNETVFNVADVGCNIVTTISNVWDPKILNYRLTVKFPENAALSERALLLGAGMLLDYMFFQKIKTNCFRFCK